MGVCVCVCVCVCVWRWSRRGGGVDMIMGCLAEDLGSLAGFAIYETPSAISAFFSCSSVRSFLGYLGCCVYELVSVSVSVSLFDRIRESCLGVCFLLLLPVSYLPVSFMSGFGAIHKSCPCGPWAGFCSSIRLINIATLLGEDGMPNEVSQKRSSVSSDVFDL